MFGPWKIERKEKILESNFLSNIWFDESQKKNKEEKWKENLSCYEEKFFLPNMRGKWMENFFLVAFQK